VEKSGEGVCKRKEVNDLFSHLPSPLLKRSARYFMIGLTDMDPDGYAA
jgi:hypothetical protein